MARGGFDYEAFNRLADSLLSLEDGELDRFVKSQTAEMGNRFLGQVKKLTPVKTGNLRNNWAISEVETDNNGPYVTVYNNVKYAPYVEYGHRQQKGRYIPEFGKRLVKSWVSGRFMMTNAKAEMETQMPRIVQRNMEKFIRDHLR